MSFLKPLKQPAAGAIDFGYLPQDEIYLDSACQTLRPQQVIDASDSYYHEYNACGGRVKYDWGRKVDGKILDTRERLLKLAGKPKKDYVCAFTLNTTYGINLLLSQLPAGKFDRLITSDIEHNSVFLPSITYAKKFPAGRKILERQSDGALVYEKDDLKKAAVVVNTASNFDGRRLVNAGELADDTHAAGGVVIFDGAQTMGHEPETLAGVGFDAVCFSGHKMYGPSLGVVIIRRELLNMLSISFIGGGTVEDVSRSKYRLIRDDPAAWLEPGLQNFAGIIGLGEAAVWLGKYKPEGQPAGQHQERLALKLYEGIQSISSIRLVNSRPGPIISFYSDKIDSHQLAIYLSANKIMARSGYFCCHYYLDSVKRLPPLLRLSIGLNNTAAQIDKTVGTIKKIIEGA